MRPYLWLLFFVIAVASPRVSFAQTGPPDSGVDKSFELGRDAMAKGDYKAALAHLRESHQRAPGRGKLANIALCEVKLGLLGSAMRHLQEVLRQLPDGDPRKDPLVKQVLEITPKVPYLRVRLAPGAPVVTTVTLDGETLASSQLDVSLPVDPGRHVVVATAPGAREARFEVTIELEERKAVTVEPAALALPPPPPRTTSAPPPRTAAAPPPPPASGRSAAWRVGVGALGLGGASIVAGAVTGGIALTKNAALAGKCQGEHCSPDTASTIEARRLFATVSTATFIAGGVLAATGTLLVALPARGRSRASAWMAPTAGGGLAGVEGRF